MKKISTGKRNFFIPLVIFCVLFIDKIPAAQEPNLVLPIGHTGNIVSAVYSADGKYILTASWDNTAKIWDASDGLLVGELKGHKSSLTSAVFSADGKFILTTSKDTLGKIWRTADRQLVSVLKGHSDWLNGGLFSPDGIHALTYSWDRTARLWLLSNGNLVRTFKGHKGAILHASFSKNGKYVITSSADGTAKIWDVASGLLLKNLVSHSASVNSAKFSSDDKTIVTSSNDGTAIIWQVSSGNRLRVLKGHQKALTHATFSNNGKMVLTASYDGSAMLWNAGDGSCLAINKFGSPVISATFNPDDRMVACGTTEGNLYLWQTSDGSILHQLNGHSDWINMISFSPDGRNLVSASSDKTTKIWQVDDGQLLYNMRGHSGAVNNAVFSPNGNYIVSSSWDNSGKVWDAFSGNLLFELKGHTAGIHSLSFSPDSRFILTASMDSSARIWQVSDGKFINKLTGHTEWVNGAIYSPNQKYILTTSWDNTGRLWDAASGQLLFILKGHRDNVNSGAFSPDSKYAATASWDNTAYIWNVSDGRQLSHLTGHRDKVNTVCFSPDGRLLLTSSADSSSILWQASDGKPLHVFKTQKGIINDAVFSPTGNYIAIISTDHSAIIWDVKNFRQVRSFYGGTGAINKVLFTPDGKTIITTSTDNNIRVCDIATGNVKELTGHSAIINSISLSPDGKFLVTTSLDNTIKKWSLEKNELLYSFIAVDNTDYLVLDREGHYDGTTSARRMLYYVCSGEIINLEQFKDLAWEPGLVSKIMGINKEKITARKISEINICNYIPKVLEHGFMNHKYQFEIIPAEGGVGQIQLFVNHKVVKDIDPSTLVRKNKSYILNIDQSDVEEYFVFGSDNRVAVKATTKGGTMLSRGAWVPAENDKKSFPTPNLYMLTIGISRYKGEKLHLNFASKDAVNFTSAVAASAQKLLNNNKKEHVFIYNFNTEGDGSRWPSKPEIQKAIDTISMKAKSDDIFIIFFAGHGVLQNGEKNFYLLTSEASAFDLAGVEKQVAISTGELREWFREIKANKQLLIMDACNSGQAVENLQDLFMKRGIPSDQQRALESLKDKTGTYILSASTSGMPAYEHVFYGQGLLTYALLYGIKLGGGLKDNKFLDVTKWFNFSADHVKTMARDLDRRQDPQIIGNASFEIGLVDKEIADNINLSIKKKVFRHSTFIEDTETLNDELNLTDMVDEALNNLSEKGGESPLVFISGSGLSEGYSVRGRYKVDQNNISVAATIIKGQKQKIFQFELTGTADKKEDLVSAIVQKVKEFMIQQPDQVTN